MGSRIKGYWKFLFGFMVVIWGVALSSASCKAQNWNEVFRQKITQEKYLLKQIAYLKVYAGQAWNGYKLVSGGLENIGGFTSGEFRLHEAFISGLSKVSSLVRKDFRIEEIVKFQLGINSNLRALQKGSALSPAPNQDYYKAVQEKIAAECNSDLDELMDIVLSGNLALNDAERLGRLGAIHASMREKSEFTRWFCTGAALVARSEKGEKLDIEELRRLYEKN
ncbi:hypothetical protein QWY86_15710 [Pedobacter aquatilis]|uniref:hypothetical protein n=1 Tax=Pedobacter aquatilis TaxID=351343 RepID=UPI0025B3BBA3|nr:hypothetical protein [Pedobacter aquatilis]MDN3588130.1 hypothetical protein [Pedobacter aquatilis]